ncbi:hypothetical protein ILUMI_10505, partial [Ignelater luminosus]
MNKTKWSMDILNKSQKNLTTTTTTSNMRNNKNFHSSLDSLANSSVPSESLSDDSHESDSSGVDTKSKNSFAVKCEVYAQNSCGSLRSWTKSESGKDAYSEFSYETIASDCSTSDYSRINGEKRLETALARMETIHEEENLNAEPKISVKEILARFENLRDKKNKENKDSSNAIINSSFNGCVNSNSNSNSINGGAVDTNGNHDDNDDDDDDDDDDDEE